MARSVPRTIVAPPRRVDVRLLLTADLHFHRPWFDWLLDRAPNYDLVAVAGDLMDMNYPGGVVSQLLYLYDWAQAMTKRHAVLALCSGNHDLPSGAPLVVPHGAIPKEKLPILEGFARHPHWLQALRRDHQVTVDEGHRILRTHAGETLMVSCAPYRADGQVLFRDGFPPPWLLLHHEPPARTALAEPTGGSIALAEFIQKVPPRYVMSGHVHLMEGEPNRFHELVGETHCFNCRQHPTSGIRPPAPNFITLDTTDATATWHHCHEDGAESQVVVGLG